MTYRHSNPRRFIGLIAACAVALFAAGGFAVAAEAVSESKILRALTPKNLTRNLSGTRTPQEIQRQNFTRAHAFGTPIVFASDAAVYPHGLNARQFPIMVQRGMTPMEAIQSATSLAAKYMGWGDRVGALTPGHFGDLVAVAGDPIADIRVLQQVPVVIKGGRAFKLPAK